MTDTAAAATFRYEPKPQHGGKSVQLLARTELLVSTVQTVGEGGETNLHSHTTLDGFWFVLRGRVKFYTTDDELIGDLGPYEGIVIPRGYPYWFESTGDEDLEILQVEASSKIAKTAADFAATRVDHEPRHARLDSLQASLRED